MCNCACVVHLLLPQIRNLKCSDLLGSGQVFGVETKTFLFLLRGECFILCSRGMLSGDLVYFTEMQKTALEQSLNSKMIQYLQEQKYCLLSSIILLYFLSHLSLSQGQAKVFALLEGLDSLPEGAEVYVVLEGSSLVHVTRAHSDVMLCFIVPGMCMCMSL